MFRKEVAEKPLIIWILSAMTAPVVQLLAGYDWKLTAIIGFGAALVGWLSLRSKCHWPTWISILQIAWLVVVVAEYMNFAGDSWPMAEAKKVIPVVLLALAAWSGQKGPAVSARLAGILLLLSCVGYGLIFASGLTQMQTAWIGGHAAVPASLGAFVLLLPGAATCMPKHKIGKRGIVLLLVPTFAVLASVITCGSIHPLRQTDYYPFYEMCRSLSLFGLAERFEALVCALLTVSWFSLLSLLLSCIGSQSQKISAGNGAIGIWISAVLAMGIFLANLHMEPTFLAAGSVIFWVLIPLLSQGIGVAKKWIKK